MYCKYCGKEISEGGVWNPDENGNGYHHRCLIDMEFDKNEVYLKDLKNRLIVIPKGATNGDVIKTLFPNLRVEDNGGSIYLHYPDGGWILFDRDWWYAPYRKVE